MAAYFWLRLDKTPPANFAFLINEGATVTAYNTVDLTFTSDDVDRTGYTIKVWGDVIGANHGPTESGATWIAWPTGTMSITTSGADGLKTINARARDRVGNETTVVIRTITVDSSVPVVTLSDIGGATQANPEEVGVAPGATIISSQQFRFQSDIAFVEYQVRVGTTPTFLNTSGTLIGTAGGSVNMSGTGTFAANTQITCTLTGDDYDTALAGVESTNPVKVFVRTQAGVWSV